MEALKMCAVVLLLSPTFRAEDSREHGFGADVQLERLVMLLTLSECEDLVVALSRTEADILKELEFLAPENNTLDLPTKRKLLSVGDEECRTALTMWLVKNGEVMYFDRLTSALQHIGRTDVAMEVGKNINQDRMLSLKRYVESYHKKVNTFHVPEVKAKAKDHRRFKTLKVSDLSSKNLEMRVCRELVSPYPKGPMQVVMPLLCGLALGFWGTFLVGFSIYHTWKYFFRRPSHPCQEI